MKKTPSIILFFAVMALCSCQKYAFETAKEDSTEETSEEGTTKGKQTDSSDDTEDTDNNVTLHVSGANSDAFTRITCSLFMNGTKVKNVNQLKEAATFGTIRLNIEKGTYQVVVVAHNGEGNATVSTPGKVQFYNNKCTDTFASYTTCDVGEDGIEQTITPQRKTALIRIHINDSIPDSIQSIKAYYTGGSSTLDATTGYGCVNSRQTEVRPASATQRDYYFYTFPHSDGKKLHLTLTAYDGKGDTIATKELKDIEVKQNYQTTCMVNLFSDSSEGEGETLTGFDFDPAWDGETVIEF